jgi:hypothetical protein
MEQYKAKGYIQFCLGIDGIEYRIYDRDYYLKREKGYIKDDAFCEEVVEHIYRHKFTKDIYDLIDGKEFLEAVQGGYFIDYDGTIADIFVDGYISNLGLATDNLTKGDFLVSAEVWSEICDEFKVEVNWANK